MAMCEDSSVVFLGITMCVGPSNNTDARACHSVVRSDGSGRALTYNSTEDVVIVETSCV